MEFDSLSEAELNAERLVRDISLTIDTPALPSGDTVIRFNFKDLEEFSYWYIKVHSEKSEVCEETPDGDVDVFFPLRWWCSIERDHFLNKKEGESYAENENKSLFPFHFHLYLSCIPPTLQDHFRRKFKL